MAKAKYKVTNWREYNQSLKKRRSLTIWLEEGFEETWYAFAAEVKKRGRPFIYSDACMKLLATLRHIFKLAPRQLEGFVFSLFELMGVELKVPEFSRLSRRLSESLKNLKYLIFSKYWWKKISPLKKWKLNKAAYKIFLWIL